MTDASDGHDGTHGPHTAPSAGGADPLRGTPGPRATGGYARSATGGNDGAASNDSSNDRSNDGAASSNGGNGTDGKGRATSETGQPAPSSDTPRGGHHIGIDGSAHSAVVAGDHNLIVDARHGSTVTVSLTGERPRPVRRERIALLPRTQRAPLGRRQEIAAVAESIRAGETVQLWGASGVGKSALLRHLARAAPAGQDGVVFLSAAHRDIRDVAQALFEACYEAPGFAPSGTELRRLMEGLRVTVYVDDADYAPEQVQRLMDDAPDATFVLAGAERSLWRDGRALKVTGLARDAGVELLARELGRPLADGERKAAVDLWSAADGNPLLLLRAAGLARTGPEPGGPLPRPGHVAALLPLLLDRLGDDAGAVSVLHLLATLGDADMAVPHIRELTAVGDAAALCRRLSGLGLLEERETGYRCTPDTAALVRRRVPAPFPADRLCRHFARWVRLPATTPEEVGQQARVIEKVVELADHIGRPDLALHLARAASGSMARSLRFSSWGRLLGHGWVASRRAGDQRAEAYFLHEEGVRALLIGKRVVAAALLAEALWLSREVLGGSGAHDAGASAAGTSPAGGEGSGNGGVGGGGGETGVGDGGVGGDGGEVGAAPPQQSPGPDAASSPGDAPGVVGPAGQEGSGGFDAPSPDAPSPDAPSPDAPSPGTLDFDLPDWEPHIPELALPEVREPVADFDVASYMAENGFTPSGASGPTADAAAADPAAQQPYGDTAWGEAGGGEPSGATPPDAAAHHTAPAPDGGGAGAQQSAFSHDPVGGGAQPTPPTGGETASGGFPVGDGSAGGFPGGGWGDALSHSAHLGSGAAGTAAAPAVGGLAVLGSPLVPLVVGGVLAVGLAGVIAFVAVGDSGDDGGAAARPTGIAGEWEVQGAGAVLEISERDGDTYWVHPSDSQHDCADPGFEVTGSGSSYTGDQEWYDLESCELMGSGAVTITLDPGDERAVMTADSPPGQPACEFLCEVTLVRQGSSPDFLTP